MRVYLFRHGAVQQAGERRFIGRTDLPLSDEGRRQAEAWRRWFGGRMPPRIVSSPLSRATAFAGILADGAMGRVEICADLAEIDLGRWDGRAMKTIRRDDPDAWRARGDDFAGFRPPGGESFEDVQRRVLPVFGQLTAPASPDLVMVAHAGVNRALVCHVLGMPLSRLFRVGQDYGCLNRLHLEDGQWRVDRINMPCPLP